MTGNHESGLHLQDEGHRCVVVVGIANGEERRLVADCRGLLEHGAEALGRLPIVGVVIQRIGRHWFSSRRAASHLLERPLTRVSAAHLPRRVGSVLRTKWRSCRDKTTYDARVMTEATGPSAQRATHRARGEADHSAFDDELLDAVAQERG